MNTIIKNILVLPGLAIMTWIGNGSLDLKANNFLVASAEARLGRPATPVSYAGVARRSTVRRAATPGLGAPGVGVRPGIGVGRPGVGVNRGGPVNRVGRR